MRSIEATGKTVEEAIAIGLDELGLSIADVLIEVLDHGQKGLFGIGSKMARVQMSEIVPDEIVMPKEMQPARRPRPQPQPQAQVQPREAAEPSPEAALAAREFVDQLIAKMNVRASAALTPAEESISIAIDGEDVAVLIGHRGETLDAIQYLTTLAVNKHSEERARVRIDAAGYRLRREESLVRLAERSADRVLKTGRKVALEPMNPYERRIMHTALQEIAGVTTHSEGEDPYRRVIITPAAAPSRR